MTIRRKVLSDEKGDIHEVAESFMAVLNPDNFIRYANVVFLNFLSKSKNELIGTDVIDCFPTGKKKFFRDFLKQVSPDNQRVDTLQKRMVDSKARWIYWAADGNFDQNNNLVEIFLTGRDVSDAFVIEKRKNEAVIMLKAFKDAIENNIICSITDINGVILYANSEFCKISQYSLDDLVGKTHRIVNSDFHPTGFYADMWQTILSGQMWEGEIRNRAKDNSIYWVKAIIVPILGYDKKIDSFISLRIPITEQKKHDEAKTNHIRTLEELLFMVSHELRRPITSIMGILNILHESRKSEDPEYTQLVEYMINSTHELDSYSKKMNDFLQTCKMEGNISNEGSREIVSNAKAYL